MRKILILVSFLTIGCCSEPKAYRHYTLKLYMLGGHIKIETFKLPIGTQFYLDTNHGGFTYLKRNTFNMCDSGFIKSNVVDFELLKIE